ncbi:MAG: molybdopterin molybdotransferase MoeA [Clostridia bacterium]
MLHVITLDEAIALMIQNFGDHQTKSECVPLDRALYRVLRAPVTARENVPGFIRSTVDGYAVMARDTFGCTESMPALLTMIGAAAMGQANALSLRQGQCVYVPTGGELPENADAMVMLEYSENFGGGTIGIEKASAPGQHLVFVGDDVKAGATVLSVGRRIFPRDVGTLAALGYGQVLVAKLPRVAILSTGDEVVPVNRQPLHGQVRDINGPMLAAQCVNAGGEPIACGIAADNEAAIGEALLNASVQADVVLLSGGSSAGHMDVAAKLIGSLGTLLFHGLALKPGKPTLAGCIQKKPVIGLPGHPVAAYCVFQLLVRPLLCRLLGTNQVPLTQQATLSAAIPSNHGREEYVPVRLSDGCAAPVRNKSGLITTLSDAQGWVCVPRDCEGLRQDELVTVVRWEA